MSSRAEPIQRAAKVATPRRALRGRNRTKLSTTVAADNFTFLETMVSSGRSDSIAEAVDLAIARLRQMENRSRLERATTDYFDGLPAKAQAEEQALARQLHLSARSVDFDREP
ncbi:MAG TPA: hypothetical protein VGE85_08235 [Terracidiphilus sp.]